jgi:hypothetical protein
VLATSALRSVRCLRFSKLVTGMHFDGPIVMVVPMDSCAMATLTTEPTRLDC